MVAPDLDEPSWLQVDEDEPSWLLLQCCMNMIKQRNRVTGVRHSSTGLCIREPSHTAKLSDFSSDDEAVMSQLATTFPPFSARTSFTILEQGESPKGKKRSYDSACYASLTPEQRKARHDSDRARRQSLTPEAREEINARRRSRMQSLTQIVKFIS